MKRIAFIALILAALMLCACAVGVPEAALSVTDAPASEPTSSPTEAPTPEPTDTPAPTAEPEPYRCMEVLPTPEAGTPAVSFSSETCYIEPIASAAELEKLAECIVLARITESVCVKVPVRLLFDEAGEPYPDGSAYKWVHTVYDLEILHVYKGEEAASGIKRMMAEGGDLIAPGDDAPRTQPYEVGGEYVLFLNRPEYGESWVWPEIAVPAGDAYDLGKIEHDGSGARILRSRFDDMTWEWLDGLSGNASEPELPRIEPWDGTAENAGTLIPEYWYPASMDELLERSADVVRVRIGGKGYEKHVYPTENGADYTAYCAIYDAEIVESYMGETNKGDTIRVEIWCGMEQGGRIALEEHPLTLTEGEEYVLFLTEDKDFDGLRYPTANDDSVHLVMHDSYQGSDGSVTEVEWVSLGFDIWPEESFSWLENLKNTH